MLEPWRSSLVAANLGRAAGWVGLQDGNQKVNFWGTQAASLSPKLERESLHCLPQGGLGPFLCRVGRAGGLPTGRSSSAPTQAALIPGQSPHCPLEGARGQGSGQNFIPTIPTSPFIGGN